ncbi:Histidine--tRNA ligase [bioreactor metagenome]|uniref:Histidine--tRNA ligase n=1 Tax=bioreactor metagenome TaxID=1076179 RepID=A0A645I936_9ZZZZ
MAEQIAEKEAAANLQTIVEQASQIATENAARYPDVEYKVIFDPSLVRGQGYYTGTVFEIESVEFRGAIAGGGRYDNLIGKFIRQDVPAVGISIGFERIFSILMSQNFQIPDQKQKIALFYEPSEFGEAVRKAESLRDSYTISLLERPKKIGPYLDRLKEKGVTGFINFGGSDEVNFLD